MADSTSGYSSRSDRKRGQHRNHYTTVKMAPCLVCGGTSTGYHFGVVSCEACKAFFRRAISKESYGRHGCTRGNDCARTPRKINSCSSCRFKRCLEAGMSKDGARRGRYSIELRTKSILHARKVESENLNSKNNTGTYQRTPHISVSNQSSSNDNVTCKSDEQLIQPTPSQSAIQFPWKQKSEFFKFSADTFESRDTVTPELTNADCSSMKAICEGYSFCQSPDCESGGDDENFKSTRVEPSCASGAASNFPLGELKNLKLVSETVTDVTHDVIHVNQDEAGLSNPITPLSEDERMMDTLITKLVQLQGALYPHHKVTDDILQKQKIIEMQHRHREEAFLCLFGSNEYTSSDEFKGVLAAVNIELDDRLIRFREKARATESSIVQYIHHSKFIPGFEHLNKQDVSNILKASYSEFWLFSNFATLNKETGVSGGTDVVLNGHKKVIKTFFPKEFVDDMFTFANSLQKLDLTLEEVSLIRVIVLTFIDRCPLKEPEKVDQLNQLFIRCLQYHLSKSACNSRSRFYKIFDRLIAVRTLMHRNKRVNETFLKEWGFLMTDFPLWKEMMVSQIPHLQGTLHGHD